MALIIQYSSPNTYYKANYNTPNYAYIVDKYYWSMSGDDDSNSWWIYLDKKTDKFYVRTVINLKKCAIDNTCE